MKNFLLQMFTWWNGTTPGTSFHTWRRGTRVGEDEFGNVYYQGGTDSEGRTRRWVIYNGLSEASAIPPGWHGWMHHRTRRLARGRGLQGNGLADTSPAEHDRHRRRLPSEGLDTQSCRPGHALRATMTPGHPARSVPAPMQNNRTRSFANRFLAAALSGCLCVAAGFAAAQTQNEGEVQTESLEPVEKQELAPAGDPRVANKVAVFLGIDKITGRIITFDVYIDETVQFGALQVTPRVCYTRDETQKPKTTTFVEVDEITLDRKIRRIFTWLDVRRFTRPERRRPCGL